MTFFEAITALEAKVEKLGMKYPDKKDFIPPVVAMGIIGRFHGARYDKLIDELEAGSITIDHYFMEMMRMIVEFQTRKRKWDDE